MNDMRKISSICIYCGSQPGNQQEFIQSAEEIGEQMARAGVTLVYGGGNSGIMGAVSQAVLENGGHVKGIIPEFLLSHEGSWDRSTKNLTTIITASMHERKQKMFELSDAFVALPGGIGTLEEIVEILTWAQLGRHEKPIGFLNTNGFWDPVFELIDHMKTAGFIHASNRLNPIVIENPTEMISDLKGVTSE